MPVPAEADYCAKIAGLFRRAALDGRSSRRTSAVIVPSEGNAARRKKVAATLRAPNCRASAVRLGPCRAIPLSANACDGRRRVDAGWRLPWQGGRGEARVRGVLKRGSETRVKSNCSSPQGFRSVSTLRSRGSRPCAARPGRRLHRRVVAQGNLRRDRCQPHAARYGLCRPLPDPPLDDDTPIEETLEALHDIIKAGKARYIGASSMPAWQFARALGIAEKRGRTRFVSMQNPRQPALPRRGARDAAAVCG
jgi:aldo/keto reductase family protein